MAVLTVTPDSSQLKLKTRQPQSKQASSSSSSSSSSSWDQIKKLVTCKAFENSNIHHPSNKTLSPIYSSCTRICTFTQVVHANTRIVDRPDKSPDRAAARVKKSGCGPPSSGGGGMQLRKLSGCYECHAIVDPSLPRNINVFSCSQCGQIFPKIESLELHQALKHAVCELGADDSSRNIVEIIFKSSWLRKENPIGEIERILKVHNTQRTIQRFEDYRDSIKLRAKRNARCAADGNELLRFHAAAITCALGAGGSTSLCSSMPACGICTIIRHGFRYNKTTGICTTASSGCADACLGGGVSNPRRAMLVCRVIAGRVKPRVAVDAAAEVEGNTAQAAGSYDSLAGCAGVYSNLEELFVFSSRAILPCFVVIYKALE